MGCTVTATTPESINSSGHDHAHADDQDPGLWTSWLDRLAPLREACARTRTYLWMLATLLGFCLRLDHRGVTNWVRAVFLNSKAYHSLIKLFHGTRIKLWRPTRCWIQIVVSWLPVGEHGRQGDVRAPGQPVAGRG